MGRNEERDPGDLPLDDEASTERGEEAQKELDEVPEPGTDPLHEGP